MFSLRDHIEVELRPDWASVWVWVPADVDFVARFPSNRGFFRRNRRISRIVLRGNATTSSAQSWPRRQTRKKAKQILWMCSAISSRCLCRHCTTNNVKRDWNCNAIVATSISSEIHIQRLQIVLLLRFNSNFLTSSHPFSHASSLFPFSILGSECDHYFFLFSPLPSPSIFFPSFYFGKRVRPLLFFFLLSPPFALYIFPVILFWEKSATITFFSFLLSLPSLYFSVFLFWEKSATITFFSFLLSIRPLYVSRPLSFVVWISGIFLPPYWPITIRSR